MKEAGREGNGLTYGKSSEELVKKREAAELGRQGGERQSGAETKMHVLN